MFEDLIINEGTSFIKTSIVCSSKVDNLKKVGNNEDQSMITIQQTDIDIDEIQDRLDLLEESIQELKLPITNEEQYKIVSFYFLISIYIS